MVGKRKFIQSCLSQALEDYIPKDNLYRRLKPLLDLSFLYDIVKPYYGKCGQQSVDPVVFLNYNWSLILKTSVPSGPLSKRVS
jgi:hypothetical protein